MNGYQTLIKNRDTRINAWMYVTQQNFPNPEKVLTQAISASQEQDILYTVYGLHIVYQELKEICTNLVSVAGMSKDDERYKEAEMQKGFIQTTISIFVAAGFDPRKIKFQ